MSAKNSSFDKPDVIYEYDSEAEGHMDEDITISYDVSILDMEGCAIISSLLRMCGGYSLWSCPAIGLV